MTKEDTIESLARRLRRLVNKYVVQRRGYPLLVPKEINMPQWIEEATNIYRFVERELVEVNGDSTKEIKRVYIAGLLTPRGYFSTNAAIDYIIACREMTKWGLKALLAGFDPFVPAFDQPFWMVMESGNSITEAMIKRYSKSWLEVCDAVVLTPGWQKSPGTLVEIKRAEELGIPVFKSLQALIDFVKEEK